MSKLKINILALFGKIYGNIVKKLILIFKSELFLSVCICLNKVGLELISLLFVGVICNIIGINLSHYGENGFSLLFIIIVLICDRVLNLFVGEDWYDRLLRNWKFTLGIVASSISLLFYYLGQGTKNQD